MISNSKLLIDQDCPMCKVYGQCFVKYNLLHKESVTAYQTISDEASQEIDMQRAQTEIAFHNSTTNETLYGIDSIIYILTQNSKTMYATLHHPLIYKPLQILYKFISYNRKVLYPSPQQKHLRNCEPELNITYRWAYIVFVALLTALIVNNFTYHLFSALNWPHSYFTELLVCFGQVAWQGTVAYVLIQNKALNYLGNMSTVSLIGGMLLLPLLMIAKFATLSITFLLSYFTMVIIIMFCEHIRRCKLLNISLWMTASWVGFRVVALSLILISILFF